jgi:hypothetical protein
VAARDATGRFKIFSGRARTGELTDERNRPLTVANRMDVTTHGPAHAPTDSVDHEGSYEPPIPIAGAPAASAPLTLPAYDGSGASEPQPPFLHPPSGGGLGLSGSDPFPVRVPKLAAAAAARGGLRHSPGRSAAPASSSPGGSLRASPGRGGAPASNSPGRWEVRV